MKLGIDLYGETIPVDAIAAIEHYYEIDNSDEAYRWLYPSIRRYGEENVYKWSQLVLIKLIELRRKES